MDRENLSAGGIVLCGGQSNRMGTSKAWLPFCGETLLQRVVRVLAAAVDPLAVVAAPDQELPCLPDDVLLVRDSAPGRGPLQGLADGLAALDGKVAAVFLTSCDMPFLSTAFVTRMLELLACSRGFSEVSVPHVNDQFHPLAAVYRLSVMPVVKKLLAEDRRRLMFLLDEVPIRAVTVEDLADVDPELRALRNLNSPEDYRAAIADAAL
jgi:molybdenum cofactor guanylyltransferase